MTTALRFSTLVFSFLMVFPAYGQYSWNNFAGNPAAGSGEVDGAGSAARFEGPFGVAVDGLGNIFVADFYGNGMIRKITSTGIVTTLVPDRFASPAGVAVDTQGNVYVADSFNQTIRKISTVGVVTLVAGTSGVFGYVNGTGGAAKFNGPVGVAVDGAGNVFVADGANNAIRKITSTGVVTTFAGSSTGISGSADGTGTAALFHDPTGLAIDGSGNIYVADTDNDTIRKINSAGVVTTFAGKANSALEVNGLQRDGPASNARFADPRGVAVDGSGNVYVTDGTAETIRKISGGVVTTIGGKFGNGGYADGLGAAAEFNDPIGIAVSPSGLLYVADIANNRISIATAADTGGNAGGTGPGWHSSQVTSLTNPNANNMADGARTGAAHATSELYFYKGTDSNMWCVYLKGGTTWTQAQLTTNTNVSDWLAFEPNYGALCYQSNDGNLWCVYYSTAAAKWVAEQLGTPPQGVTVAGDIVVDSSGGWNNIYYRGSDSHLYAAYLKGSTWTHVSLGGTATVKGNLAVEGNNHLIYYQGTDNNIWCFYYTGKVWEQVQLSTTANVGGTVAVDSAGLIAYYKSSTDGSLWCTYPVGGTTWTPVQLDATANMSTSATSFSNIEPYNSAHYNTEYLDNNGQFNAEYYNGSKWGHTLLGDGGSSLTGGLSLQPVNHWFFARRSDGNVIIFYNQ